MESANDFSGWAIIEIMGHQKFAGYVQTQPVAGASMVRVDVPELPAEDDSEGHAAFTKLFGSSSIYCLTPVSEEVARAIARTLRKAPVDAYDFPREVIEAIRKSQQRRLMQQGAGGNGLYPQPALDDELDDELDDDVEDDDVCD